MPWSRSLLRLVPRRQPATPSMRSPPHHPNLSVVNTTGLILIWVSRVLPHVQGRSRSPEPCAGEPAQVWDVRGALAPAAGVVAVLLGSPTLEGASRAEKDPGHCK